MSDRISERNRIFVDALKEAAITAAVAAALMAACQGRVACGESSIGQQLESIDIRYVRPAIGSRDLFTNSCFEREGKAASFVRATCFHKPEKPLATAIATFVR